MTFRLLFMRNYWNIQVNMVVWWCFFFFFLRRICSSCLVASHICVKRYGSLCLGLVLIFMMNRSWRLIFSVMTMWKKKNIFWIFFKFQHIWISYVLHYDKLNSDSWNYPHPSIFVTIFKNILKFKNMCFLYSNVKQSTKRNLII